MVNMLTYQASQPEGSRLTAVRLERLDASQRPYRHITDLYVFMLELRAPGIFNADSRISLLGYRKR